MKIPEIVLKVESSGCVVLWNDQGTVDCPWGDDGKPCGSWCPHFEVNKVGAVSAEVILWCTARPRAFRCLRVVEPENKEETK